MKIFRKKWMIQLEKDCVHLGYDFSFLDFF